MATSPPDDERRQHTRVQLQTEIHLTSESNFYTGLSNDISEGGVFVATHQLESVGTELEMEFSLRRKEFRFEFDADPSVDAPKVSYVPELHYPDGFEVELSEGVLEETGDNQALTFRVNQSGVHTVVIKPKK